MKADLPPGDGPALPQVSDPDRLLALRQTGLLESHEAEPFQRATRLASKLLGAPVSLVSLVDADRQIFIGQSGLPDPSLRETPLSHSFCRHVVERDAALVVPDARENPALRDNGAVTDLGVISYLGVPLRTLDGQVLGSFCAIGHDPRDWTKEEHGLLSDIAAGVEAEIRLRRQMAVARSEQEVFRAVLDQMPVGVGLAEAGTGRLVDMNATARELLGSSSREPGFAPDLEAFRADGSQYGLADLPIARAAISGEVVRAEAIQVRRPGAAKPLDLLVAARRIESDPPLAVATALDVTELNAARRSVAESDQRLAHFHDIMRDGVLELDGEDRVRFANTALRARLRDTIGPEAEADLIGAVIWERLPHLRGTPFAEALARARETGEPQSADQPARDGRIFEARFYPEDATVIGYLRDVTEERMMVQAQETLARELNHRIKNVFAMMSGLIGMTARHADSPEAMAQGLRARIGALARAHDLLSPTATLARGFKGTVDLETLLRDILSPYVAPDDPRLELSGPMLALNQSGTTNLAMVFHELATNAVKYGALSHEGGHLSLRWTLAQDGRVEIAWRETGNTAPLVAPSRSGFGSRLIGLTIEGQMHGRYGTEWGAEGFSAQMSIPIEQITG